MGTFSSALPALSRRPRQRPHKRLREPHGASSKCAPPSLNLNRPISLRACAPDLSWSMAPE